MSREIQRKGLIKLNGATQLWVSVLSKVRTVETVRCWSTAQFFVPTHQSWTPVNDLQGLHRYICWWWSFLNFEIISLQDVTIYDCWWPGLNVYIEPAGGEVRVDGRVSKAAVSLFLWPWRYSLSWLWPWPPSLPPIDSNCSVGWHCCVGGGESSQPGLWAF